jgi:1,4-alpha-glucan branching enzyme
MKKKSPSSQKTNGSHNVRLEVKLPQAQEVFVAGSFNNWKADQIQLLPQGDSRWVVDLNLAPGRYEYRFIVNGEWISDPAAQDFVPNVFGTFNSVLHVEAS